MRLAITGAAGSVGSGLRGKLDDFNPVWIARRIPDDAASHETWRQADVTDPTAIRAALDGCDALLHLACVHGYDINFEETLDVNYRGTISAYDAAVDAGVKHLIFTSSNHGWGFYKKGETPLNLDAAPRPDGWYGIAKIWGEAATAFYAEAYGLHATSLRIGHTNDHVPTPREGHMWTSFDDFAALISTVLHKPQPGHRALWATTDCKDPFFDSADSYALGWAPKDDPDAMTPDGQGPGAQDDIGGKFAKANRKS